MLTRLADFVTFVSQIETKMEKYRSIIVFGWILVLTILVVFLSYRYVISVKNREIQRTFYLFKQSVEQEKVLMQPGQMFLGDSKTELRSDSVIIETEKGKVKYKKNKQADSLTLTDKREWVFQMFIAFENPNRAFTLDSLFQEELKSEGIIAQTAVSFSQGTVLSVVRISRYLRQGSL